MFRKRLLRDWVETVKTKFKFPISDNLNLINVIGNKVSIGNWKTLYSLPKYDLSIENGIISWTTFPDGHCA